MRRRSRVPFYVLRLPVLLLSTALLLFGLGFAGWRYYNTRLALEEAEQIQLRLQESLETLESYYARFKTTLYHTGVQEAYRVDLWKSASAFYRLEMTRLDEGGEAAAQVVVFDGVQAYLYSPDLDDFYPIHDLARPAVPYLILEDYWRSVAEAEQLQLLTSEPGSRHRYYLVEIYPPEPHRHRVRELAWLEAESLLPVRIEIYDIYNSLSQVIAFEIIRLNPELEASLFHIEPAEETESGM
ncbi:MAG: hypothetical protein AB1767_10225 [Bacillota bacterium]